MANIICIDSCILIEHFRAKDKTRTYFERIHREYDIHCIPSIAKYEVLAGVEDEHLGYWETEFSKMLFLPLTERAVRDARTIAVQLRRKRLQLDTPDILIAATAIANGLPLATLNRNHFERIDGLKLVLPK